MTGIFSRWRYVLNNAHWDVSDVILPNCYYCCRSWTSCCVARYASSTTRQPCSPLSVPTTVCSYNVMYIHVLMRDEKEERSKQTTWQSNIAHPRSLPKKNELTQMGLEPTTLYTLDRAFYHAHVLIHIHTRTREP